MGANVISLLFNLLTSFLLPKYLSVDGYAAIKTFQLYVVYVGLLHLGYADGMYLKYGRHLSGKNRKAGTGGRYFYYVAIPDNSFRDDYMRLPDHP